MVDARAWLLWALTVLLTASYSRNPLYGILMLLVTTWVHTTCALTEEGDSPLFVPLRFALFAIPLAAVFNALSAHIGETRLYELPAWIPLFGGPVTLEAIVFGAINGLNVTVIFSGFTAFNRALAVRDLIKLTPRALHESGIVLSIALTFAPQTVRSLHRIREAQAVRGRQVRGLRDWAPIFTPLLVSALERALTLAEAMASRGFAATAAAAQTGTRVLLASGLLLLLGGWGGYLFAPNARGLAGAALGLGTVLFAGALWQAGRAVRRTVYRPGRWRARDTLVVAGCLPALALLLARRGAFYYTPYPRLAWPVFEPWVGLCVLGLLVPALIAVFTHSPRKKPQR
ncbi:MAG: energy-coupling factor transporter transmembrane protein EcfT [Anaerolineae bacterium]|nr:energy-coupling factor transporter transmembrane protein EcfT [Anaerolineae bacterium]